MASPTVTNRQHPFVQQCRRLAAGRGEPGTVLLDGPHLIAEALAAGVPLLGVLADERAGAVAGAARARQIPVHSATRAVVDAASPVRTPSGIVAIARWRPAPVVSLIEAPDAILIGLAGVQDPGNVGNIIRSADALGASGVVALDGTADPAGWKAMRGAMGSTFRLPVATGATADVLALARTHGVRIAATVLQDGVPLNEADLSPAVLVLIGSEGAGLPDHVSADADIQLTIPMRSSVNSLNAATTAALVLWELARVRRDVAAVRT